MQVEPYLNFDGRCEEAAEFYRSALSAEVLMLVRYGQTPGWTQSATEPEVSQDKVIHATIRIGQSVLKATDGQCKGRPRFEGINLSLVVDDAVEGESLFSALGEGGRVNFPFAKTFFSKGFGIVADRFGVNWMVVVQD